MIESLRDRISRLERELAEARSELARLEPPTPHVIPPISFDRSPEEWAALVGTSKK